MTPRPVKRACGRSGAPSGAAGPRRGARRDPAVATPSVTRPVDSYRRGCRRAPGYLRRPLPRILLRRPPAPFAALAAALALGVSTLGACTRVAPPGLPAGTTLEDLPEAETWDARLRTSDDGRPLVEVDAPYLARFRRAPASAGLDTASGDSAAVFLGPPPDARAGAPAGRVSVRLFDATGAPAATVSADRAWLQEASGRLVAEGRVEATVGSGGRVAAPRLTATRDGAFAASGGASAVLSGASITAATIASTPGGAFTASGGATAVLSGRAQATVRARTISGSAGGGRYEAAGGAHVDASGGRRLDAGLVVWDEAAGRFRAPGAFSFDGPGERVRGVGLEATADLSRYSFRRASGQIEVRE